MRNLAVSPQWVGSVPARLVLTAALWKIYLGNNYLAYHYLYIQSE